MSLYGALDKTKHFDEFNSPLPSAEGTLSPDVRKRRAIDNLMSFTDAVELEAGVGGQVNYLGGGMYEAVLKFDDFDIGDIGDNANLAFGAKILTLPEGSYHMLGGGLSGTLFADVSVKSDTPEIGVGTTAATGAQATLGAVAATAEDIIGPFVAASINNGAVAGFNVASGPKAIAAGSGGQALYLNAADGWANVDAVGALLFTGTIVLRFVKM